MRTHATICAAALVAALLVTGCGKKEPEPTQQQAPAAAPEAAEKLKAANTRIEELNFQLQALEEKLARMDKVEGKLAEVERELAMARSAINALEKQPIPAPAKVEPAEEPAEEPGDEPAQEPTEEPPAEVDSPTPEADIVEQPSADVVAEEAAIEDGKPALPPGDVSVLEMQFATEVNRETRQATNVGTVFSVNDERLYCYLVLGNKALDETEVVLHWVHEEKEVSSINLRVGANTNHWRTWAYIRPKPSGTWKAQVTDLSGNLVGEGTFTVE